MDGLHHFKGARDRGVAYLLAPQGDDGAYPASGPNVADYYKVVTAFQVCGHDGVASRVCDWLRHHGMTANGDW